MQRLVADELGTFRGAFGLPGGSGYAPLIAEARGCNSCSDEEPALVVQPLDAADVCCAVRCAVRRPCLLALVRCATRTPA